MSTNNGENLVIGSTIMIGIIILNIWVIFLIYQTNQLVKLLVEHFGLIKETKRPEASITAGKPNQRAFERPSIFNTVDPTKHIPITEQLEERKTRKEH